MKPIHMALLAVGVMILVINTISLFIPAASVSVDYLDKRTGCWYNGHGQIRYLENGKIDCPPGRGEGDLWIPENASDFQP